MKRLAGPFYFFFTNFQPTGFSARPCIPKRRGHATFSTYLLPRKICVNDFIDPTACSVQYSSIDQAVEMTALAGRGAFIAKTDMNSAFRLLPVSPADFDLLGFRFLGKYYVVFCVINKLCIVRQVCIIPPLAHPKVLSNNYTFIT